ncbi:hypothetical protein BABINDRAFT_159985 [Babjeviella inositovora NRRL Y-12698]|uniref:Peptide hydrolase n=1 Tax=Babjeviella inositovora NRRL Y-12698 TaxID=984486 RepID=A0A1E3QVQ2_9ASCO|nr:uncharacterized protein BABINDRAFT_159985 [Babjeviella inositovora NRRL Y-12698]ODQ81739.1 hypothetical protein BABINDRAFT_159985 [Babjeviella inositovora NRRL Y-12698]
MEIVESDKLEMRKMGVKFLDITDTPFAKDIALLYAPKEYTYPAKLAHTKDIKNIVSKVDKKRLHTNLGVFSSFHTRYYKSDHGLASAQWLQKTIQQIIASSNTTLDVEVVPFKHEWKQFSIIVKIPGSEVLSSDESIVVVGSHQDSVNLLFPSLFAAPGADDDGSGTVTCLEALTLLLGADFQPRNNVEFHFYSAEEGGCLGSLAIFAKYKEQHKAVVAMLQQDMTGYSAGSLEKGLPDHVGLITDYTNHNLNVFLKTTIEAVCDIDWMETKCGYACSDHSSASKFGYPSAFIIESTFENSNHFIHSTQDTIDKLSFEHMAEHVKLTVGYAYELGMSDIKEQH